MNKLLIIFFALLLNGCVKKNQGSVATSNPEVSLEKLFEYDGCVMYRFLDNGHYVYWTDTRGRTDYDTGGRHTEHISDMTE